MGISRISNPGASALATEPLFSTFLNIMMGFCKGQGKQGVAREENFYDEDLEQVQAGGDGSLPRNDGLGDGMDVTVIGMKRCDRE